MAEIELLKTLYKKSCKMEDGRLKGGFINHEDPINKAIDTAIEALEKQLADHWIPAEERLPNKEECSLYEINHPCHRQFLCTVKIGDYEPQTRQLFFSKVFGWVYGPADYNQHVLAWRPLPEPHKEVQP